MNMLAPKGTIEGSYDVVVFDDFPLIVGARRVALPDLKELRSSVTTLIPGYYFGAILAQDSRQSIGRRRHAWNECKFKTAAGQ